MNTYIFLYYSAKNDTSVVRLMFDLVDLGLKYLPDSL